MIRSIALVFLVNAISFAQVEGPYTLYEGTELPDVSGFQVLAESDSTARVFYQLGSYTWMQVFNTATGNVVGWPTVVGEIATGYVRALEDVLYTPFGWVLLTYDSSASVNQTILTIEHDDIITAHSLGSAPHYPTWDRGGSSMRDHLRLTHSTPNKMVVTWVNYWQAWVGFPEAGIGFDAQEYRLDTLVLVRDGSYGGAAFTLGAWAIHAESDSPLVIGMDEGGFVCAGNLYGGDWWSPCGWFGGFEFECDAFPVGMWESVSERLYVLTRSATFWGQDYPAMLLNLDTQNETCSEIVILEDNPASAAINDNIGATWISIANAGLLLTRATLDGVILIPAGTLYWTESEQRILQTDLALSSDGEVFALWSEERIGDPTIKRLRIASIPWDEPLSSEPSAFHPQPSSLKLAAFPNPFNSELRIEYELNQTQSVSLEVMNLLGQEVARLEHGRREAGVHSVTWKAETGGGIYFVRLQGESQTVTQKVLYLKLDSGHVTDENSLKCD